MNKINFYLESRLNSIKKKAKEWENRPSGNGYRLALNHQVKYGRKGWIKYDSPNHYNNGNLCLESLSGFNAVELRQLSPKIFNYSGYFADNFQIELIKPYIVRIVTKKGLFIAPAIAYSDCDMATIYLSEGEFCSKDTDSINYESCTYQVAKIADRLAERLAEDEREHDAQYQAQDQSEALKDDNKQALKQAHDLIQAIKAQRSIGEIVTPICNALISEIKSIRQKIRANNERISALKENFWLAVE